MKRIWWRLRLAVKDFWCYSGYGSMLVEYCEDCGVRVDLVWWSPKALWTQLTGYAGEGREPAAGILCPNCFDARARAKGIHLYWHPTTEEAVVFRELKPYCGCGDSVTVNGVRRRQVKE